MPTSLPPPQNRQAEDRAVVVGISHYPGGFLPLQVPVLDAFDFNAWLLEPGSWGLTAEQIRLITTPFPPPGNLRAARPVEREIQDAFDELDDLAQGNGGNGHGPRAGRRLYLYFSGNGAASVLMADRTLQPHAMPLIAMTLKQNPELMKAVPNRRQRRAAMTSDRRR